MTLRAMFVMSFTLINANAAVGVHQDTVQCAVDDHGSCAQEASISLLQSRLEVVRAQQPAPDSLVGHALQKVAADARAKLLAGTAAGAKPEKNFDPASVFSAVDISLPLAPPIIQHPPVHSAAVTDRKSNMENNLVMEDKNIVMSALVPPCVVYGLGVASASTKEQPSFENKMAERGCVTHAFDCSVAVTDPNVVSASFTFHPWCIGRGDGAAGLKKTIYVKDSSKALEFKTLAQTMEKLGHSKLDLLKFDIEGSEWQLFSDELLQAPALPLQMSFELHTEGANPHYVPPEQVAGKGYAEVNKLFLTLFDRGYRVISKEINMADPHCAEFVVVKM